MTQKLRIIEPKMLVGEALNLMNKKKLQVYLYVRKNPWE